MDPRLTAFLGPHFERVFGAVATVQGARGEEAIDMAAGGAAQTALSAIIAQAEGQNPDPAARLLLIAGQTGTGKTHTLALAACALHRSRRSYACVLPMVDLVSETHFDAWLLRSLIIRLSEPYLVDDDAPVPLQRLAERLLAEAPPGLAAAFRDAIEFGQTEVDASAFRLLVNAIRIALAKGSRQSPVAEGMIAALLGTLLVSEECFDYLCGHAMDMQFSGIRLTNDGGPHAPRARLDDLMKLIAAGEGALLLAFDQLEQSKLDGWEARARHAISRGAMLAETLPNLAVTFAVLPSLYEAIADGLDPSVRDRLERLGAQPVRLAPLGRADAETLLAQRLAVLWDTAGVAADSTAPLYPFPDWFSAELGGETARYVTERVQEFRRLALANGRVPGEAELAAAVPPVSATASTEAVPRSATEDFDAAWERAQVSFAHITPPAASAAQAELVEWALRAAAAEIDGIDRITARRMTRGPAQTSVVAFEMEAGGRIVERREAALCNEPNSGSSLTHEITAVLAGCGADARAVLIRGKGGRFPRAGRGAGPVIEGARGRGAIVIPQVERASWERLQQARSFIDFARNSPGFPSWQARARPLSRIPGFGEIITWPHAQPAELVPEISVPVAASEPTIPAASRLFVPKAAAVLLGHARGNSSPVYWAPGEAERKLLNFGVLVTGDSGSGKTQSLRVLIDGATSLGLPVTVFDFKNDYADAEFCVEQGLRVHNVRRHGLPFNPLVPSAGSDGMAQPIEHIFTICSVMKRVFGLGEQQVAVLRDAMKQAFQLRGIDPQSWQRTDSITAPSFNDVIAILEESREQRGASAATTLINRVAPLFELGLFPHGDDVATPFEDMLKQKVVLSLYELPSDEIKSALAELIIIRMHGYLLHGNQPRRLTRLLVLDEAWRVAQSKNLEKLAREGRAFGVGLAIGTQFPGDLPPDLAGSLATRIFLKNQAPDHRRAVVRAVAGQLAGFNPVDVQILLERFEMFEGLIQNEHYQPFESFRLEPYFARERPAQRTGTTD